MSETDTAYNRLQFSMMFDKDQIVVRSETGSDLLKGTEEIAENAAGIHKASVAIRNAMGIMNAAPSSEPKTTQTKSFSRTVKPGDRPAASGGKECEHGQPWKDLNGKTYQKGEKAGQLYPNRFYNSCGNRSCTAWGDQE